MKTRRLFCNNCFSLVFIILTFCCLCDFHVIHEDPISWSSNDENAVCVGAESRLESRYVPYVETYKKRMFGGIYYKTDTRINYKTEYHVTWFTFKKCCNGYIEKMSAGRSICQPICEQTCQNSNCTGPNHCACFPGYEKFSIYKCDPICTNPCVNGTCISPETCSCKESYWLDSDGFTCRPPCLDDCEKMGGYCWINGQCACHPGYELDRNKTLCEPHCDLPCTNSFCSAPDICTCLEGYDPIDAFTCDPRCTEPCTTYSTCIAPETCECFVGYQMNSEQSCTPICEETCVQGSCIAPNFCSCFDGYALMNSSDFICEPVCLNDCIGGNCTAPDVCSCEPGYFLSSEFGRDSCKPLCDPPCGVNGECIEPSVCTCYHGFLLLNDSRLEITNDDDTNAGLCVPACEQKCINGKCISPNACKCNTGYHLLFNDKSTYNCQPICAVPCGPNSFCFKPNECSCKEGFHQVGANIIEALTVLVDCSPICEKPCDNGICSGFNTCSCDDGYKSNEEGLCIPFCDISCENGICIKPNTCKCNDGYIQDSNNTCIPYCDNCENGNCVAPYQCECQSNFEKSSEENDTKCIRTCARGCNGHGTCIDGQQLCQCFYGWTGNHCETPTLCSIFIDSNNSAIENIHNLHKANETVGEIYYTYPQCLECINFINNETTCFELDIMDTSINNTIGCFFNIAENNSCCKSPTCYPVYERLKFTTPIAIVGFVILSTIIAVATMYLILRKKYFKPDISLPNRNLGEENVNETLVSDETYYF
ncbi:platelet endothelial aggregation receptor 1-like isoform X2 [Prorops nasuta]|uniref:platelet endothelial aggregation receptor 1-like isoform X2 n=1 Tax=Prorops nasuta TaxID=863751 RepID=UPI0034CF8D58